MTDAPGETTDPTGLAALRDRLRQLFHGQSAAALRFQLATTIVDVLIIAFFIATPLIRDRPAFLWIDYSVAVILAVEIAARLLACTNVPRTLRQPTMLLDLFILATLLAPAMPGRFSTMTCCFHLAASFSATERATMSVRLPAEKGTTSRTS